jgi:hypothetical protein
MERIEFVALFEAEAAVQQEHWRLLSPNLPRRPQNILQRRPTTHAARLILPRPFAAASRGVVGVLRRR